MSMHDMTDAVNVNRTPQTEPIPGREQEQVKNSAGGFVFALDDWQRLERFLVLGTDGGTYYAAARKLTRENAACVVRCVKADGFRTVKTIVELSESGRAPKNDPAVFALALCLRHGDNDTKQYVRAAFNRVCRTGTHVLHFAEALQATGGWGAAARKTIREHFVNQPVEHLAYDAVKYQQRDGWSQRDLLRLAHVKPPTPTHDALFRWITRGEILRSDIDTPMVAEPGQPTLVPDIVLAFEDAKRATTAGEIVKLITDHNLPRECIPTALLNSPEVWEALLFNGGRGMPLTALIRNLAKMTAVGLLKPLSREARAVAARLEDLEGLRKGRIHPLQVLMALRTYEQGHGEKGKLAWEPVPQIVAALGDAFMLAFHAVEPSGARMLLGLDVSGSMSVGGIAGSALTPREASAAMAMVTVEKEPQTLVLAFADDSFQRMRAAGMGKLPFHRGMSLREAVERVCNLPWCGTDCSLPMRVAAQNKIGVDTFVVYTDNETWAGGIHPIQALRDYRQKTGIAAKLCVVGMTSTGFTIADPDDAGSLDVVGFDAATPALISDFSRPQRKENA